jgi:hypothetical protein
MMPPILFTIRAILTFAAGVVLVAWPGAIPSTVGIQIEANAYLMCHLLAAMEFSVASLSWGARAITAVAPAEQQARLDCRRATAECSYLAESLPLRWPASPHRSAVPPQRSQHAPEPPINPPSVSKTPTTDSFRGRRGRLISPARSLTVNLGKLDRFGRKSNRAFRRDYPCRNDKVHRLVYGPVSLYNAIHRHDLDVT